MTKIPKLYIALFLLIGSVLFSACFTQKKAQKTVVTETTNESTESNEIDRIVTETELLDTVQIDREIVKVIIEDTTVIEEEITKYKKEEFNIAVLLPFNVNYNTLGVEDKKIYEKSKIALEFYEGVLIALDELKLKGFKVNMTVHDTEGSGEIVKQILNISETKDMDLIIGPIYNGPLKVASEFSKRNKIYMVSPLSPKTSFVSDNPYYLNLSSSLDTHCNYIYDDIISKNFTDVIVLYQNKNSEIEIANKFISDSPENTSPELSITKFHGLLYDKKDKPNFRDYLTDYNQNVFIISSNNEYLVNDVLGRLFPYRNTYDIVIYGMPKWDRFENIDPEYFENLDISFTNNFYKNRENTDVQFFEANYYNRLNKPSTQYANIGYDMMHYFGQLLMEYPEDDFEYGINNSNTVGTYTGFDFTPVFSDSTGNINFYENKFLHLLNYQDYILEKVED